MICTNKHKSMVLFTPGPLDDGDKINQNLLFLSVQKYFSVKKFEKYLHLDLLHSGDFYPDWNKTECRDRGLSKSVIAPSVRMSPVHPINDIHPS